jgi:hypothetical protein
MEHNLEIVTEPLPEEVIMLGLGDTEFLVPQEQVKAKFGMVSEEGVTKLVIYVQDIEVLAMDPVSKQVRYRVTGFRQYMQPWDLGGSMLNPELLPPEALAQG